MSVRTTADDRRDEAKEYIEKAYKCLLEVLDPETWGSEDFNKDYIATVEEALVSLIKLKRDL